MRVKQALSLLLLSASLFAAPTYAAADTKIERERTRSVEAFDATFSHLPSSRARIGLRRAWSNLEKGNTLYERASRERNRTKRARLYDKASRELEKALDKTDRIGRSHRRSGVVVRAVKDVMMRVSIALQRTNLALADAYVSRGAYKNALDAVDQVLYLDPKNAEAVQLKKHIQLIKATSFR